MQLDCGLQLFDNHFLDGSKWDWFLPVIYKYIVMEKFAKRERKWLITFPFFSVPARILESASSKDINVQEGRDVTLWCNATGIPEPNITWFRINNHHGTYKERKSY